MQYSLFQFRSAASLWSTTVVPIGSEGTMFSKPLRNCGEKSVVSMEQRRNERARENGRSRENPPTSGIVRAQLPIAKIRDWPSREWKPVRIGGRLAHRGPTKLRDGQCRPCLLQLVTSACEACVVQTSSSCQVIAGHGWNEGQERVDKGYTDTCVKRTIASNLRALNWRAVFPPVLHLHVQLASSDAIILLVQDRFQNTVVSSSFLVCLKRVLVRVNCLRANNEGTVSELQNPGWLGQMGKPHQQPVVKTNTTSVYTLQKAKSKYRNRIQLERASQKQSSDTHKTSYDRVKRCRERKINIKASQRANVDVFTEVCMEQRRNASAGGTGDPRENLPTSGIVRSDSLMRKSGHDPAGNLTRLA
ncbi:hypothetical protein PR048_024368 [Dryococelus australis]|uniref:Uncharacterized protein n=1 Tax=Dryococelus australis TaxID=614101 RepID=A0ABQ9GNF6_9NEOP|nr:hypothetical protein PR048_024368 [Dryococelus australis]